jgi:hypothetical protein
MNPSYIFTDRAHENNRKIAHSKPADGATGFQTSTGRKVQLLHYATAIS